MEQIKIRNPQNAFSQPGNKITGIELNRQNDYTC
ncbi:hypothetical protein ABIC84_001773 [Mucilaginibacter sp. 3215]